ncbi:porin family protein [Prevotella sp. 10(H)]|uniref:porin family protein n=1 Tax=Prevotella sp. 10(H) TaxID=1158294 RepID=UPI0004A7068D|nr:porin family protein [Prevotella sp. 10(H)]
MKQIFKISLIAIFFSAALITNAQEKKLVFGAKAGFVFSDLSGYQFDTKIKYGFTAGLTFDYFLKPNIFLTTGLEVANKGSKFEIVDNYPEINTKITFKKSTAAAIYLQIPVHAGYQFDLSKTTRLSVQAGPYVAYGVGGQTELGDKVEIQSPDGTSTIGLAEYMKMTNGWRRGEETFSDTGFRDFDFGVGAGAAIEYEHVNIGLKFDFGLYDVARGEEKVKNRNGYITLGYKF